jgi:septation ring formation regulator EzrA
MVIIGIVIIAIYCFAMGYFIRSQEKTKGWEGY